MVIFVYCRHIYRSANIMDLQLSSTPVFGGTMLLISYSFLCPLLYVFRIVMSMTIFAQKTMFGSSLPPFVGMRAHVLFTLFAHSGMKQVQCCVFVLFFFVLCTLCCHFLWIVNFCWHLRYTSNVYCNFVSMRNSHLYNTLELINTYGFGVLSEITANTRIIVKRLL